MKQLDLDTLSTLVIRWARRLILASIAVLVIGIAVNSVVPAQTQRPPAVQELVRVGLYLAYYDQLNRIAVAQNQLSAADADARLRSKASEVYNRSFTRSDFDQLVEQHRQAVSGYFSRVEQEVNTSTRWPRGMRPESGKPAAKSLLQKAKGEYESAVAARHDPLSSLMGATMVRGLAMGYETPPATIDVFGDQWQRITNAMPSATTRDVMGKLVNATQQAAAQVASQTGGERPIPGEMGSPTGGERPIPGEMGGSTAGGRPIPGEMGTSTPTNRPRIGPVPGERTRTTSPGSLGVGPQLAELTNRPRIGPVPGERTRVTSLASSTLPGGMPASPGETGSLTPPPTTGSSDVSPPPSGGGVPASTGGGSISPPQPGEDENAFWARVYAANTREAYELYLRQYPNGVYADIARAALSIQAPQATTPATQP